MKMLPVEVRRHSPARSFSSASIASAGPPVVLAVEGSQGIKIPYQVFSFAPVLFHS